MSAIVKTIRDNFETLIGTTLGATWQVLENKYKLDNGHNNNQTQRFGVIVGSATGTTGVTKSYTLDRSFDLMLLNKYNKESDIQATVDILEDALDEVTKVAIHNKLGTSANVLNVEIVSVNEIELNEIEKVAILRATYLVKYRNPLI